MHGCVPQGAIFVDLAVLPIVVVDLICFSLACWCVVLHTFCVGTLFCLNNISFREHSFILSILLQFAKVGPIYVPRCLTEPLANLLQFSPRRLRVSLGKPLLSSRLFKTQLAHA